MIKPRKRLVDTEAIALHYQVARGTIRRWASEDQWTPYGTRRKRLWDLLDAQRSYERRRPLSSDAETQSRIFAAGMERLPWRLDKRGDQRRIYPPD